MARELKVWLYSDGTERRHVVAHSVAEACRLVNEVEGWARGRCGHLHFKTYALNPNNEASDKALAKGVGVYPEKK